MREFQTTLKSTVNINGKGLHSGRIVRLVIEPAEADHGIVFKRTDSELAQPVKALALNIGKTTLNTSIGEGPSSISTIEHLMAAFCGLEIHNALVKIDGPEVPILDGSAKIYVEEFEKAGVVELKKPLKYLKVKKEILFERDGQSFSLFPSLENKIDCTIDFGDSVIGKQSIVYTPSIEEFKKIAFARTFCRLEDVNNMRAVGLALGGSLENAIVISQDEGIMNEEGLRCDDEFVCHKLLDLIGDLYLLGAPLLGGIKAVKPGHTVHSIITKQGIERFDEYFELVTLKDLKKKKLITE
jgi:UDP-3-O-[3-hydroxymyristoyl] N-acetylglucosamine deacetylase